MSLSSGPSVCSIRIGDSSRVGEEEQEFGIVCSSVVETDKYPTVTRMPEPMLDHGIRHRMPQSLAYRETITGLVTSLAQGFTTVQRKVKRRSAVCHLSSTCWGWAGLSLMHLLVPGRAFGRWIRAVRFLKKPVEDDWSHHSREPNLETSKMERMSAVNNLVTQQWFG